MGKINSLITIALFYLGWFGCVFLSQTNNPWQTLAFPIVLISFLYFKNLLTLKSISAAIIITIFGTAYDSFLLNLEFISTPGYTGNIIPIWLFSIWLLFSFSMMKIGPSFQLPKFALAFLGFLFGPLSYKSGEVFNALYITSSFALLNYAIFWAIFFPCVIYLSKRCA